MDPATLQGLNELTLWGVSLTKGREKTVNHETARGSRPSRMPDKGRIWKGAGAIFVLWKALMIAPGNSRVANNYPL